MAAQAPLAERPEGDREDQTRMSFWDHIEELRQRLKIVLVVVILLFAIFLATYIDTVTIGGVAVPILKPALGATNVATQFFVALKNDLVPTQVGNLTVNFAYQEPWDGYVVMFKVAFFLALLAGSPAIAFEVGRFIGPALKPSEKRLILRVMTPVVLLFLAGVALCFVVVLPFTFRLLYGAQIVGGATFLILYADSFINFVLLFALGFGLAFQLPVLMYGLGVLGIVKADFWKKYWRFAVIGIFAFGALITPDGSGVTMMLVSLPMLALYVGGYVATRRMEVRRDRAKSS